MRERKPIRLARLGHDNGRNIKGRRYHWMIGEINNRGYTQGAEVGVYEGLMTHRLLQRCPQLHLYAVDKWEELTPDPTGRIVGCENWDVVKGKKKFYDRVRPYLKRLTILEGDSAIMAREVEDETLDFVFIDADHRYEAVWWDIVSWVPKLKPGGLLSGHDIHSPRHPEVDKAVRELVPNFKVPEIDRVWFAKKEDYVHPGTNTV